MCKNIKPSLLLTLCISLIWLIPNPAAAFSYAEGVDGDLSGDRFNPTNLGAASLGSNLLTATSVAFDLEYFTFSVGASQELIAIDVLSWTSTDDQAFGAVQSGTVFTEPASGTNTANLLGWDHFGSADVGTSILDDMSTGPGAIGFSGTLGPGDYTFWFQETGAAPATYALGFQVVPIPAAVWLFGSGLGLLGWLRRRQVT